MELSNDDHGALQFAVPDVRTHDRAGYPGRVVARAEGATHQLPDERHLGAAHVVPEQRLPSGVAVPHGRKLLVDVLPVVLPVR